MSFIHTKIYVTNVKLELLMEILYENLCSPTAIVFMLADIIKRMGTK